MVHVQRIGSFSYKVELKFVCTYNFTIESVKINGKSRENVDCWIMKMRVRYQKSFDSTTLKCKTRFFVRVSGIAPHRKLPNSTPLISGGTYHMIRTTTQGVLPVQQITNNIEI